MAISLNNLVDASGNGRHLVLGGSTEPAFEANPWAVGQAAVVCSSTVSLVGKGPEWPLPSGDFTVRFRIKRTSGHNGVQQIICGRWGYVDGAFAYQWLIYFNTANQLVFILSATLNASSTSILTSPAITDTSAHAIEVSRASGQLSLYVDGARVVGPVGSFTQVAVPDELPFMIGNYADSASGAGFYPLWATIGDFELANVARHTAASYTVSSSPLSADANSVALLPLASVQGARIASPTFVGNILLRGSFTPASGGWANPDGPLQALDGSWYFTASAYNSSVGWTCWAITASTLSALLSGSGTIGAAAIQTPATGESGLAANGSVVGFNGTYWHYYHDQGSPVSLRYSSGSNLGAPFAPQPGNVLWTGYFDPMVRRSDDGSQLIMLMSKEEGSGRRSVWRSTSSDGSTWSTPAKVLKGEQQAGFNAAAGEFSFDNVDGSHKFGFSDGAPQGTTARRVMRWATLDGGLSWLPLGEFFNATGTGVDAGANAYLTCYDSSPFFDSATATYYILATHSTNTAPVSPTNSDIGLWSMPLVAQTTGTKSSSLGAAISIGRSGTVAADASISAGRTSSVIADAAVRDSQAAQSALDAALRTMGQAVASVDVAVRATGAATAPIDAAVQLARSATAALDLAVAAQRSATAAMSTQVQAGALAAASLDAYVQAGASVGTSASAAVLASALAQASVDIAVMAPRSATGSVSAALNAARQAAGVIDAALQLVRSASSSMSAQVQAGTSAAVSIDVAVRDARAATSAVEVAIATAASAATSLGAVVSLQRSISAAMTSAVLSGTLATLAVGAYVSDPGAGFERLADISTSRALSNLRLVASRPPQLSTTRRRAQ